LQVSEYWVLSREHTALDLEMEQIYKDAVPNARKIVNPRAQLESQLQALRGEAGASEQGFLALLVEAGRSLTALADVELNGLRYKDGQLDLSLEGGTLEVLDRLKQQLAEQSNLDIQMRTSKREGRVESQLVLRRTSS
jgi:general secretion pathway protein L